MRLRRRTEPTVTFYLGDGDTLEVPDSQVALASHLLNSLCIMRDTVVDLNARIMELEGDEYEDNE
jgi:hypothetical protein